MNKMCFISTSDQETYKLLKSLGYEEIHSSSPGSSLYTFINKKLDHGTDDKATFNESKVVFHNKVMV